MPDFLRQCLLRNLSDDEQYEAHIRKFAIVLQQAYIQFNVIIPINVLWSRHGDWRSMGASYLTFNLPVLNRGNQCVIVACI